MQKRAMSAGKQLFVALLSITFLFSLIYISSTVNKSGALQSPSDSEGIQGEPQPCGCSIESHLFDHQMQD